MIAHIKFDRTGKPHTVWYECNSDQEESTLRRSVEPLFKPSFRVRLARWALPWVAGVITRLPFNARLSLWLDKLQAACEEDD